MNHEKKDPTPQGWKRRKFLRQLTSGLGLGIVGFSAWELSGCEPVLAPKEGDGAKSLEGGGQKEGADAGIDAVADAVAEQRTPDASTGADATEKLVDTQDAGIAEVGPKDWPTEPTPEIPSHEEPVFEAPPEPQACLPTEDNIEGPFYRNDAPWESQLAGPNEPGTPLVIEGVVLGPDCRTPLANVTVDVWQANNKGSYDNDGQDDPPAGAHHLRGRMRTNAKGEYKYTTILPGKYLNGQVLRPAHIHYKVYGTGYKTLTTQLYFEGDPHIKGDPFVRPALIIPTQADGKGQKGTFRIVLKRA